RLDEIVGEINLLLQKERITSLLREPSSGEQAQLERLYSEARRIVLHGKTGSETANQPGAEASKVS
ncbi:MAG: hypothetical protein AAB425_09720, partial [Bdellovibrionota bacterium]